MKQIGRGVIVALLLAATLSGCAMTSVRQHPDFANGERKIKVVAILPAEVEYRHLVFTGENERDAEREKTIASEIESGMGVALQNRGYTTKFDVLNKARSGDKEFNFQLEQLKGAYVQISKELYAQPMVAEEESTKFKVGVGPLANPFAEIAGADALILARYQGFDKSGGLLAKEITGSVLLAALTGVYYVPAKSGGQIELSLIDGVSGEVLWSNAFGGPMEANASLMHATVLLPSVPGAAETKVATENLAPVNAGAATAETPPATEAPPAATEKPTAAETPAANTELASIPADNSLAANPAQAAVAAP